ncbi:MAG: B12-binding domain-containing radical SAM protein [bacterium]
MRIELIQPRHRTSMWRVWRKRIYMTHLNLAIISALTPPGVEVSITDDNLEEIDFDKEVDLVGITCLTATAPRAYEIADRFRARGVPVVLGGIHPSLMPEEASQHADAVVIGEAEGIWQELIEEFKSTGRFSKRFYRANGTGRVELKNMVMPNHHLTNKDKSQMPILKAESARGCPFDCDFCSTTAFFGNKYRFRPVSEVVREIKEVVRRYGRRFIFFTDDNIIGNVNRAKELFQALIPLKIKWVGQGSINFAKDDELLDLAKRSGCAGILIGFESLVAETLLSVGKKINAKFVDLYESAVKKIHSFSIPIIGCFVVGFDRDDVSIFERVRRFIEKVNIDTPQISILTPFPGTRIRERLRKAGRIIHDQWEKYDALHVAIIPQKMSPKELRAGYDYVCGKVYSYWSIFKRTLKGFFYLKSIYKSLGVVFNMNLVYRKLYLMSRDDIPALSTLTPA